jgi:hypothetical protein
MRVRVRVNFEREDKKGRIYINTFSHPDRLNGLKPGAELTLYDKEMEVDAVAEFDETLQWWYGIPDWSTRRDLPPLDQ